MNLLLYYLAPPFAFLLTSMFLKGFKVSGFGGAVWASIILAIANITIRPLLLFFTFPITLLTMGLFLFVLNGIVIKICAALVDGFDVEGWIPAIVGAFLVAFFTVGIRTVLLGM